MTARKTWWELPKYQQKAIIEGFERQASRNSVWVFANGTRLADAYRAAIEVLRQPRPAKKGRSR